MATKSSRKDQMAAVEPFPATKTMSTRRTAATMMKILAEKITIRLILRHMVVLTGKMTGAGIAIMQMSVRMFKTRAGSRYIADWGSHLSVVDQPVSSLQPQRVVTPPESKTPLTPLIWVDLPHS